MKKMHKPVNFRDSRGFIQDICIDGKFEHATFIYMKKGAVRGNHYHKKTTQYMFVAEGKLAYYGRRVSEKKSRRIVLNQGDFIETPPFEVHAVEPLKDAQVVVLAHGPRGGDGYESDTYRIETPATRRP